MNIKVGTFNLNNLFSRYNFQAEISAISENVTNVDTQILYQFGPNDRFKIRRYKGRLVMAKDPEESSEVATRIRTMDADVLAVQEVEDIDTLKEFNRILLNGLYQFSVLVEGNDPRLIDIGVLSKYPIGGVTSWQHAVHPNQPDEKVFGRDLLEVQVLNERRTKVLFSLFNNHLKSHYVDFREDPVAGEQANNQRRRRQAEMVAEIVKDQTRPNSRFIILGDMNDPPDSAELGPFVSDAELDLTNALANPQETRPPKQDDPMPASPAWTYRHKESGQPAEYSLYDQIWLSSALKDKQTGAWIDRRTKHGGDGSDHDPAWIELDI